EEEEEEEETKMDSPARSTRAPSERHSTPARGRPSRSAAVAASGLIKDMVHYDMRERRGERTHRSEK
ncbi:hypothetical protein PFISCL1PPCAC_8664, partial [Pristionchus fissidentatus]